VAAVLLGAVVGGCAEVESSSSGDAYQPATVTSPDANGIETVSLTREAAEHIDLVTEPVRARGGALVVPYAAVIYDKTGQTWVYSEVGELSYRRVEVAVRSFDGPEATLSSGPPVGVRVVTTGATQVYGTELGMASKH
jgi:hypothetical protein